MGAVSQGKFRSHSSQKRQGASSQGNRKAPWRSKSHMFQLETINFLLALGTLGMQLVVGVLLALYFFGRTTSIFKSLSSFLQERGLLVALLVTLVGSLITLYYSEVLGIPPCPLCWWQRVFLYPQVVLLAFALWRREQRIADYSIVLSVIGLGFAAYHHALQILPSGTLPCPAEGTISCAQRFVFEFGYITFPLMSATLFAFLIALMLFSREQKRGA